METASGTKTKAATMPVPRLGARNIVTAYTTYFTPVYAKSQALLTDFRQKTCFFTALLTRAARRGGAAAPEKLLASRMSASK